jgi:hypothetical protein
MFGTDTVVTWQSQVEIEPCPPSLSPTFIAVCIKSKCKSQLLWRLEVLMAMACIGNSSPPDLQLMKIFALLDTNKVYGQNL